VSSSESGPFLWLGGSEKNRLFTADVQNDAQSPAHMQKSCCPLINSLVDHALQNAFPRIDDSLLQVADVADRCLTAMTTLCPAFAGKLPRKLSRIVPL